MQFAAFFCNFSLNQKAGAHRPPAIRIVHTILLLHFPPMDGVGLAVAEDDELAVKK